MPRSWKSSSGMSACTMAYGRCRSKTSWRSWANHCFWKSAAATVDWSCFSAMLFTPPTGIQGGEEVGKLSACPFYTYDIDAYHHVRDSGFFKKSTVPWKVPAVDVVIRG